MLGYKSQDELLAVNLASSIRGRNGAASAGAAAPHGADEIVDTGNSEEALAMAMQGKPNAILLDLRMPNYSGFELCRTFKSMTSTQLIPIVVISGEASASTKHFFKELGATAYFEKPVDFDALRAALERVLRAAQPERRSELRVLLWLHGSAEEGIHRRGVSG
jgi:DNA-binding response OmpR family regulator